MTSRNQCDRCGRTIKEVFRVGDFIFGSECVFHAADFIDSNQPEKKQESPDGRKTPIETLVKAFKRLKRQKKEFLQEMPEVGVYYKHRWNRYVDYVKPTEIYFDEAYYRDWRIAFEESVNSKVFERKMSFESFLEIYRRRTD